MLGEEAMSAGECLLLESGQSKPESTTEEDGADYKYTGHLEGGIENDLC